MRLPNLRAPSRLLRAARPLVAAAILGLTAGCHGTGGMDAIYDNLAARLFGPPPRPALVFPAVEPLPVPRLADRVVVLKGRRLIELVHRGEVFESFPIALGPHPDGPKERKGDGRTPEGRYVIDGRSAVTRYTRELHISYPDAQDWARARAQHVDPGGAIFIHGLPEDYGYSDPPHWYRDWTEGCIAVGNRAIGQIWDAVPNGTPVDILP
jgi:hypothetical protein